MGDTVEIPILDETQRGNLQRRPAGRIGFDDRGNAIYEWQQAHLRLDGTDGDERRAAALDNPGLALVDDEPQPDAPIRRNLSGLRVGYNPYDSGELAHKAPRKPRDMHKLSQWIKLKKKLAGHDK